MKPSVILFFVLRQDTELVAVMEIKSTQAADFLNIRKRPFDPIDLNLLRWGGKSLKPYGIRVLADALRYSVVGIILSELIEPLRSLPAFSDRFTSTNSKGAAFSAAPTLVTSFYYGYSAIIATLDFFYQASFQHSLNIPVI